jgi:hypothetical protein
MRWILRDDGDVKGQPGDKVSPGVKNPGSYDIQQHGQLSQIQRESRVCCYKVSGVGSSSNSRHGGLMKELWAICVVIRGNFCNRSVSRGFARDKPTIVI